MASVSTPHGFDQTVSFYFRLCGKKIVNKHEYDDLLESFGAKILTSKAISEQNLAVRLELEEKAGEIFSHFKRKKERGVECFEYKLGVIKLEANEFNNYVDRWNSVS